MKDDTLVKSPKTTLRTVIIAWRNVSSKDVSSDSIVEETKITNDNGDEDDEDDDDPGIYYALRPIFIFALIFGLMPIYRPTSSTSRYVSFRWLCPQTIYSLTVLSFLAFFSAFLCNFRFFAASTEKSSFGSLARRLGGPLFYTSACISIALTFNISRKIPELLREWDRVARRLLKYKRVSSKQIHVTLPRSKAIGITSFYFNEKRWPHRISITKATLIATIFMTSAILEHTLHDVQKFAVVNCGNVTSFIDCNLNTASDFISVTIGPSRPFLVVAYVLNKYANVAWNFHDLFVILLSFSLSANFKVISDHMKQTADKFKSQSDWRQLREDHLSLCQMVNKLDKIVGPVILLSYVVNVYFVANQIFQGIRPTKGDLLETFYVLASFGHLVGRLCFVTFSASKVYDQAREPLLYLYICPALSYNTEVLRFSTHINFNTIGFTGCQFFVINRSFFLAIVSLIFTYELLLLDVS